LVIGVAGGSGSGKTTVSQVILRRFGAARVAYVPHDLYYRDLSHLPFAERVSLNFDHPDALETSLFVTQLDALRDGQSVAVPTYDFTGYTRRAETVAIASRPLIVVEGILIYTDPALRERIDVKVFVDAPGDVRLIRRIQRDVHERGRTAESVIEQYLRTVRPMHDAFVETSRRFADVIIPNDSLEPQGYEAFLGRIDRIVSGLLGDRARA
jgi:uridine kinase